LDLGCLGSYLSKCFLQQISGPLHNFILSVQIGLLIGNLLGGDVVKFAQNELDEGGFHLESAWEGILVRLCCVIDIFDQPEEADLLAELEEVLLLVLRKADGDDGRGQALKVGIMPDRSNSVLVVETQAAVLDGVGGNMGMFIEEIGSALLLLAWARIRKKIQQPLLGFCGYLWVGGRSGCLVCVGHYGDLNRGFRYVTSWLWKWLKTPEFFSLINF